MNKIIEKLAKQAGLVQTKWADADTEKVRIWQESLNNPGSLAAFAELIIRECAEVADRNYDRGFSPVGGFVKEHFNIEE